MPPIPLDRPTRLFVVGRIVPVEPRDFESWRAAFERMIAPRLRDEADLDFLYMGRGSDVDCGDGSGKEPRATALIMGAYPALKEEDVSRALERLDCDDDVFGKWKAQPSPSLPDFRATLSFDTGLDLSLDLNPDAEDTLIWIAGHGVPDFDQWFRHFSGYPHPPYTSGIVRTMCARGHDRQGGIATAVIINQCIKGYESKNREFLRFDYPPFVGGADWIKNGAVFPPFDPKTIVSIVYEECWEKMDDEDEEGKEEEIEEE